MTKLPTPRWPFGTILYLRVAPEGAGMVTGYLYRPNNTLLYVISWGDKEDERWESELTEDKTFGVEGGADET